MNIIKNKRQHFFLENLYPSSTPTQSKGEFYSRLLGVYPPLPFQEIKNYRSKEEDDENYQKLLFSNMGILRYFYFPILRESAQESLSVGDSFLPQRRYNHKHDEYNYKHQQNVGLLHNFIFSYRNFIRVPKIKNGKKSSLIQKILSLQTKGFSYSNPKRSLLTKEPEELLSLLMLESFICFQKGKEIKIEYEEYFDFYGIKGNENFDTSMSPSFYFLSERYKKDIEIFFKIKGFQEGKGYCGCYSERHRNNPFSCGYSRKVRYEENLILPTYNFSTLIEAHVRFIYGGITEKLFQPEYKMDAGYIEELGYDLEYFDIGNLTNFQPDLPMPDPHSSDYVHNKRPLEEWRKQILEREHLSYSPRKRSRYVLQEEEREEKDYLEETESAYILKRKKIIPHTLKVWYAPLVERATEEEERNLLNLILKEVYIKTALQQDFLGFLEKKYGPLDMRWLHMFTTTNKSHLHEEFLESKERIWNGWFWDGGFSNIHSMWHYVLYVKSRKYEGKEERDIKTKSATQMDKYIF